MFFLQVLLLFLLVTQVSGISGEIVTTVWSPLLQTVSLAILQIRGCQNWEGVSIIGGDWGFGEGLLHQTWRLEIGDLEQYVTI